MVFHQKKLEQQPSSNIESFFSERPIPVLCKLLVSSVPPVNVIEMLNCYEMQISLPRINKENLLLEVQNGKLIIKGSHDEAYLRKGEGNYTRYEFQHRPYERTFNLPSGVRVADIFSAYEQGLLNITLPMIRQHEKNPLIQFLEVPLCKKACDSSCPSCHNHRQSKI